MINSTRWRVKNHYLKRFVVFAGAILLCAQVTHAQAITSKTLETWVPPAAIVRLAANTNLEQDGWLGLGADSYRLRDSERK